MVGIVVVAMLATISILYFNYFSGLFISVSGIPSDEIMISQPAIGVFDVGVLKNQIFIDLKKFGDYPINIKEDDRGRQNPFIPY